jgi:hypothetical protein
MYVGATAVTIAGFIWMNKTKPHARFARSAWLGAYFGMHGYLLFDANPFVAHGVATVWVYAIFDWQDSADEKGLLG